MVSFDDPDKSTRHTIPILVYDKDLFLGRVTTILVTRLDDTMALESVTFAARACDKYPEIEPT
jgi:hypothetical protein